MDKVGSKFKSLEYPFLIDIVADGTHIVSLNSTDFRIKVYRKSKDKMEESLKITGKSNKHSGEIKVFAKKQSISTHSPLTEGKTKGNVKSPPNTRRPISTPPPGQRPKRG